MYHPPAEPNTANVVLVVRFSDETTQNGYNSIPTGSSQTAWASTTTGFNSDFMNYIATATRGQLHVQSLFPQSNGASTVTYLTLDMTKAEWSAYQNLGLDVADSAIVDATAEAFNKAYPSWSGAQANLYGDDEYIDNTMILVDTAMDTSGVRSNSNYYPGLDSKNSAALGGVKVGNIEIIHAANAGRTIYGAIDAVPAHEYLHRLGATDLYRNSVSDCEFCRGWDIMASATSTLLPLAQTAEDIGALTKIETKASTAGTYEFTLGTYLSDDENAPHAVAIKSPKNDSEYFVLEYRQGDLETFNGYKADVYMGGKSRYDTSGAYDGVIISRVNPAYRSEGNKEHNYLYVFRPGDTTETSKGGDGKTGTYKNANIAAGESFGNAAVSAGIEQSALCYSDGTNSRIVVEVESVADDTAKVKVTIPDYSDEDAWTALKNSSGETTFSAGSSVFGVSLALSNGTLWGTVSGLRTRRAIMSRRSLSIRRRMEPRSA